MEIPRIKEYKIIGISFSSGNSGSFTLSYAYQISGKLKSITDPFSAVINYNDDKTARTTSITGSNFASQTN